MRGRPVHPRAFAQVALVVAGIVAVIVAVRVVRETAPETTLPTITEGAPSPDDPDIVTCERTLPDAPGLVEELQQVEPIGRVNSVAVMECPDAFDGQPVVYVGEVIGDVLRREGGAWLLVNDDPYALEVGPLQGHSQFRGQNSGLSVWLPDPLPDMEPGGPNRRGTILEIHAIVHRADPADGGGLTLRAFEPPTIVAGPAAVGRIVNQGQVVLAIVLAAVALALSIVERRAVARR